MCTISGQIARKTLYQIGSEISSQHYVFVECIDFKCKLGSAGSRINRIAPTTPVTNNIYHLIKANPRCIAFRENINHLPVIPRLSANGKYFAKSS